MTIAKDQEGIDCGWFLKCIQNGFLGSDTSIHSSKKNIYLGSGRPELWSMQEQLSSMKVNSI